VIFDSRFGNTEKVAISLEAGLEAAGVKAECFTSRDVKVESIKEYDLICVGAPTEAFSASKPMKEFLGRLKGNELSGKCGFAFNTKVDSRFSGSGAKFIEKDLERLGLRILEPRESAIVVGSRGKDGANVTTLRKGEEERLHQIGKRLGTALEAAVNPVPA